MSEYKSNDSESFESVEYPWRDKEVLHRLYIEEGLTLKEMGERFGCTASTVYRWMERLNIDRRNKGALSAERLRRQPAYFYTTQEGYETWATGESEVYVHRLLAVAEFGFDAVCDKIVHHGASEEESTTPWDNRPGNIQVMTQADHMSHHSAVPWSERVAMWEMYKKTRLSQGIIAEEFGVDDSTVSRSLKQVAKAHGEEDLKERITTSPILTWDQRVQMWEEYRQGGVTQPELADKYDVSAKTAFRTIKQVRKEYGE